MDGLWERYRRLRMRHAARLLERLTWETGSRRPPYYRFSIEPPEERLYIGRGRDNRIMPGVYQPTAGMFYAVVKVDGKEIEDGPYTTPHAALRARNVLRAKIKAESREQKGSEGGE